ncbi:MAG: DUF3192 domain-containing protein [bacterium]|jgi:hypothetical protein
MKHLHSPIQWAVHLLILLFILSAISCTSPGKIRERNRNNLNRLTLDMSRQQVLTVMKRPYRSETLSLSNGKRLELLYYHTDLKTPDGAVTDDELTPVVLIEDKVIGWGWILVQRFKEVDGSQGLPLEEEKETRDIRQDIEKIDMY